MSSSSHSPSSELTPDSTESFECSSDSSSDFFVQTRLIEKEALHEWALFHQNQGELPFYLHPDWLRAADKCLFEHSLLMVSVYDGGDPSGSVTNNARVRMMLVLHSPNKAEAKGKFSLSAPQHDHLTLGDVLIADGEQPEDIQSAIAAVIKHCAASRLVFSNLPDDSFLQQSIKNSGASDGTQSALPVWACSHARESAFFNLVDGSAVPPGKLKRNLKRLKRKLEQEGNVESHFYEADEALKAFEVFLDVEASGWKGFDGTGSSIQGSKQLTQFYLELLKPEFDGLIPEVHHLCLDEKVIAVQYALRTGQVQYILKISYDENYGSFSPGSLLLDETIERARQAGVEKFSLVTNPPWAQRWHPQLLQVSRSVAYRSKVLAYGEQAMSGIRNRVRRSSLVKLRLANVNKKFKR